MPRIIPEPKYFSMPSTVVGAVALKNEALNWTPCVRSLIQVPLTWTNSPAEIIAAWPRTVTRSRWPRALTRSTQKPFSDRYLHDCSNCFRLERIRRVGLAPTGKRRLITAHPRCGHPRSPERRSGGRGHCPLGRARLVCDSDRGHLLSRSGSACEAQSIAINWG